MHPSTLEADTEIRVHTTELGRRHPVPWPHRGQAPTRYVGFQLIRKSDEQKVQAEHVVKGGRRYKHVGTDTVPASGQLGAYFRKQIRLGYLQRADAPLVQASTSPAEVETQATHSAPPAGPAEESTTTGKASKAAKKG